MLCYQLEMLGMLQNSQAIMFTVLSSNMSQTVRNHLLVLIHTKTKKNYVASEAFVGQVYIRQSSTAFQSIDE